MSGTKGHFERGRWIEGRDPEPEPALGTAGNAAPPLPGKPEEHEQIERAAHEAAENLERAINGWATSARLGLKKL
ncbi:hypothetical protein FGU65_06660 [Methanoculleus sp. FWC-SCC1]|uniref:Uncharacterized protein n=1 Tax=Methanoculleus frigidifontis TaxID=2584085 RepID=A0ABT8M9I1_9EURY|nr:hypothetical protein [Methanoculleus sp. FWC-SCC1]MDN7024569.1 hypothetical protein [Methanoculleus sp. FWC-SCC1]